MIFHEQRFCLIRYFWKSGKIWNCRLLQNIGGAFRVNSLHAGKFCMLLHPLHYLNNPPPPPTTTHTQEYSLSDKQVWLQIIWVQIVCKSYCQLTKDDLVRMHKDEKKLCVDKKDFKNNKYTNSIAIENLTCNRRGIQTSHPWSIK